MRVRQLTCAGYARARAGKNIKRLGLDSVIIGQFYLCTFNQWLKTFEPALVGLKVIPFEGVSEKKVLELAAVAERFSDIL